MTNEQPESPPLSFEQKLAIHQFWTAKIDAKRRELLALTGATSALLVAIPLVAGHVAAGSPTAIYFVGAMAMLFALFTAAIVAGADFGTVTKDYHADRSIDDARIPRSAQTWRRQILSLGIGTLALFSLCSIALAAISDDLKPRHTTAAVSNYAWHG